MYALIAALLSLPAPPPVSPPGANPLADLRVSIETVDGSTRGVLRGIHLAATPLLELGDRRIPLRDVLYVSLSPPITYRREVEVTLADGSRVFGGIGEDNDDSHLSFNGRVFPDGTRIPLEWIRSVQYHGLTTDTNSGSAGEAMPTEVRPAGTSDDTIVTRQGATLSGIVDRIDDHGAKFEDKNLGKLDVPWEKIRSITIAPLEAPPHLREGALEVLLHGVDGSRIRGELKSFDLEASTVRIASPLLGAVSIEIDDLKGVELRLGRVVYLSERDPRRVEEGCAYISDEVFASHFTWQRNRSVLEKLPLRIGDRTFQHGLGVHSECRLTYAVEPGDRIFQSWIGVDVTGRPNDDQLEAGVVIFRIELDGKEVYRSKDLSWRDPAQRVQVELADSKELSLIVEMGKAFHILDRADWGDARILRE